MPSTDATSARTDAAALLDVARRAIEAGIDGGRRLRVRPADYPPRLREPRATFVTLRHHGELRGCMGCIEAHRALVEDVAHNAHAAAFGDPRFPPLARADLPDLDVHVSVLSPIERLTFVSEADLVRQLRPDVDGLLLEEGRHVATLLPSVWRSVPEPRRFLRALKEKAGLPPDHWSADLRVSRYTVEDLH